MTRKLNPGRARVILTALWMLFFLVNSAAVLSYGFTHDKRGIQNLELDEALACLPPVLGLYAGYLGGILAFWLVRPFPKLKAAAWDRFRLTLAIVCTLAFNVFIAIDVLQGYLRPEDIGPIQDLVSSTVAVAGKLSFIVGPVLASYFGGK